MRLALALGVALAAMTTAATAQPENGETHIFVRHAGGGAASRDANNDGWVTRDEAVASADRTFDMLDSNDDGRLNDADHEGRDHVFQFRLDGEPGAAPLAMHGDNCTREESGSDDDRRVTIMCRGGDGQHPGPNWEARIEDDDNCTRQESGEGANRRVTVTCTREEHEHSESSDDGEQRIERHVIIRRGDGEHGHQHDSSAPHPPHPPMPPHPPVFAMMMGDREEFDSNGDGALSREEFRAQQLRFFEASDGNNDGRVRAVAPPEPPEPPVPPEPPAPPTPPRR
jgi:hypothetical protein